MYLTGLRAPEWAASKPEPVFFKTTMGPVHLCLHLPFPPSHTHTHTHTHRFIYVYIIIVYDYVGIKIDTVSYNKNSSNLKILLFPSDFKRN